MACGGGGRRLTGTWFIIRLLPWFTIRKPFPVVLSFCSIIQLQREIVLRRLQQDCLGNSINSLFPKFKVLWKATRQCLCAYSSSLVNDLQLQACRKVDKGIDSVVLNRVFSLLDKLKSREGRRINIIVQDATICLWTTWGLKTKTNFVCVHIEYWSNFTLLPLCKSVRKEVQDVLNSNKTYFSLSGTNEKCVSFTEYNCLVEFLFSLLVPTIGLFASYFALCCC